MRSCFRSLLPLLALLGWILPAAAQDRPVLVFAAASLKTALDEIHADLAREGVLRATASFAASSALARQIEGGAPADVFVSADLDWMDYLDQRKLVREGTRSNLLSNAIVLVAPRDSRVALAIAPGFPLAQALGDGRLAMADPASVPAGKYGQAALETLGVWSSVSGRVARAENVRAALVLVARGEAPLGIVYRTDAAAESGVRIVDAFPPASHPPITYPVAILAASTNPAAAVYLARLRTPGAARVLQAQGFALID